nr:accessory gland protein Acp29AB-like [Drosophila takahashii]
MSKFAVVLFFVLTAGSHYGSLEAATESQSEDLKSQDPLKKEFPPANFMLIGTRYFYIDSGIPQNWTTAASSCRQMGGYLAAFKDEEETDAILARLTPFSFYYVGINDQKEQGNFVSLASDKAAFLKWSKGEPVHVEHAQNCVSIFTFYDRDEGLLLTPCSNRYNFICQADVDI